MRKPGWNRPVGFRLAPWDGALLLAGVVATGLLWRTIEPGAWIVAIVLGHFFLFCNVFRVRTRLELVWCALFVVNAGAWTLAGQIEGPEVLLCQLPATVAVVLLEVCSPSYHGVLAGLKRARRSPPDG